MKKAIAELNIDSKYLYERLIKVKEGDIITYTELSEIIKRDVTKDAIGNLTTARRIAQKENQSVFEAVRGVGLKRLTDEGKVKTGSQSIDKIRRAARRGAKKLSCVDDFDGLPNDLKLKHNADLSILGVMAHMTKPSQVKKIEHHVGIVQKQLPLSATLEAFK